MWWQPGRFDAPAPSGGFPRLGVPFVGSLNEDFSCWGSILASPYFGKLPFGIFCSPASKH